MKENHGVFNGLYGGSMFIFMRLFGLLITPFKEWKKIEHEDNKYKKAKYFQIMMFVFCLIYNIFRIIFLDFSANYNVGTRLITLPLLLLCFYLYFLFSEFINDKIANFFASERNIINSKIFVRYSSILLLFISVMDYIKLPIIRLLFLGYFIFIRFCGLKIIMKSKRFTIIYSLLPELLVIILFICFYFFSRLL